MSPRLLPALLFVFTLALLEVDTISAEIVTTVAERQSMSLTIYNHNLALVRDSRRISLPTGEHTLAFKDISSKIQPETAILQGDGIDVVEQSYEFALLSPTSLLQKYVGREIRIVRRNPVTGEEHNLQAEVLSTLGGAVLRIGNSIETAVDGRVIYPDIPANLREKPTLTMLLESRDTTLQDLELSYLTEGLSWKADYVAKLHEKEERLDLKCWVTLTNSSGVNYENAKLQLIAGKVNRIQPESVIRPAMKMKMKTDTVAGIDKKEVSQESIFTYHLYTVNRPTTILDNQSKQIALLQEDNAVVTKELVLRSANQSSYWRKVGVIGKAQAVDVFLQLKNDNASNLGLPKPAGIIRVYKTDRAGLSQFLGEDRIEHTPANEGMKIKLGKVFDVTADWVQTDFDIVRHKGGDLRIHESEYEITLKNGKAEDVIVRIEEIIPGDWQILSETQQHKKENATTVSWKMPVKAKSSAKHMYRVRSQL